MSCVVTFIAWIINKINKIIDLRDEEIHRLREEMKNRDQRGYNRSIESNSAGKMSAQAVHIEMADFKNHDLLVNDKNRPQSLVNGQPSKKYAKFEDEIQISDRDYKLSFQQNKASPTSVKPSTRKSDKEEEEEEE